MTQVQYSTTDLCELAARLRCVSSELERTRTVFNDDGSLHSSLIDDALEDFSRSWSDKRESLLGDLRDSANFLDRAAADMTRVDAGLARGLGTDSGLSRGQSGSTGGRGSGGFGVTPGGVGGGLSSGGEDYVPTAAVAVAAVGVPPLAAYDYAGRAHNTNTGRNFSSRNCTDYTAWSLNRMLDEQGAGWDFENTMTLTADGGNGPGGKWGNGANWLSRADQLGYSHDSAPQVGAVAFWGKDAGMSSLGHVGIVREVQADGTIIVDSYDGLSGAPMEGTSYKPGGEGWPQEFIHIVPGT